MTSATDVLLLAAEVKRHKRRREEALSDARNWQARCEAAEAKVERMRQRALDGYMDRVARDRKTQLHAAHEAQAQTIAAIVEALREGGYIDD